MKDCKAFSDLTLIEQKKMVGEIVHAMRTDPVSFITCRQVINGAKARGRFENIKFMPEREEAIQNELYERQFS